MWLSREARTKWIYSSPPANFRCNAVGRSRQGRLIIKRWALTVEGIAHRRGRRSRVSRSGCTRAQQSGQLIYRTELLAWRSPPNGDRRCPSHLSHHFRSNVRGTTLYSISDSQFAGSHRGRKRLSREATKRTVLALEWPAELVQIGRCKSALAS